MTNNGSPRIGLGVSGSWIGDSYGKSPEDKTVISGSIFDKHLPCGTILEYIDYASDRFQKAISHTPIPLTTKTLQISTIGLLPTTIQSSQYEEDE